MCVIVHFNVSYRTGLFTAHYQDYIYACLSCATCIAYPLPSNALFSFIVLASHCHVAILLPSSTSLKSMYVVYIKYTVDIGGWAIKAAMKINFKLEQ